MCKSPAHSKRSCHTGGWQALLRGLGSCSIAGVGQVLGWDKKFHSRQKEACNTTNLLCRKQGSLPARAGGAYGKDSEHLCASYLCKHGGRGRCSGWVCVCGPRKGGHTELYNAALVGYKLVPVKINDSPEKNHCKSGRPPKQIGNRCRSGGWVWPCLAAQVRGDTQTSCIAAKIGIRM